MPCNMMPVSSRAVQARIKAWEELNQPIELSLTDQRDLKFAYQKLWSEIVRKFKLYANLTRQSLNDILQDRQHARSVLEMPGFLVSERVKTPRKWKPDKQAQLFADFEAENQRSPGIEVAQACKNVITRHPVRYAKAGWQPEQFEWAANSLIKRLSEARRDLASLHNIPSPIPQQVVEVFIALFAADADARGASRKIVDAILAGPDAHKPLVAGGRANSRPK